MSATRPIENFLALLFALVCISQPAAQNGSHRGATTEPAGMSVFDLRAGGDLDKRYFLIGGSSNAPSPISGYKLVLVMPGGDGGADFSPFVRNIWKKALGPEYLIAQLVAKEWNEGQFQDVVWPTDINPWNGMKFSTNTFIAGVIHDVRSRRKIDDRHIYTLSWSSGGPAAYAAALHQDSPITASFVAMSIFKPHLMPPLENARGRVFYLLHSPQDFIPIAQVQQGRDLLQRNGALVRLDTYAGGHGWHGNVFGMIRNGIRWMDTQTTK